MSFMLTRMFAYFTLFMYLVVGVVAVRVFAPEMTTVEVSSSYLKYFSKTEFNVPQTEEMIRPEIVFTDIKFPVEKKILVKKQPVAKPVVAKIIMPTVKNEKVTLEKLPFYEAVVLSPVILKEELPTNQIALYSDFKYESAIAAVTHIDEVSTKLAAAEPEFFEYPIEEKKEGSAASAARTDVVAKNEIEEVSTNPQIANNVDEVKNVDNVPSKITEEVVVDDLITFDYSKATQDVKTEKMPVVSAVTTQQSVPQESSVSAMTMTNSLKINSKKPAKPVPTQEKNGYSANQHEKSGLISDAPKIYQNRVTIQISGTDFKTTQNEVGFEVRPQDDLNEAISDYNNGSVVMEQDMARPNMTRAITVLKRGFVPTNTDLILEEGASEITLPLVAEETFNEMLAPYESRGPIGAVLVELDDDVESASLDVPYSQVLKLDENMKITSDSSYSYQLFVGAKAGNAMLAYKGSNGEVTSKIIHIHEHELTFETNFFELSHNEKVVLVEDDLLSTDKNPLIVSSEEVRQFATDKTVKKINDHTYKTDFRKTLLAGRKYLELGHQQEPVFVGYKESTTLEIPSENFMRYILSRFEGSKLGNRCLVQVNLDKKAVKVDVGSESAGENLQTSTQILDADGKFYDSVGEKSRKIIVVGENQGAEGYSLDSKINLKITYQDGSVHYLGSYCSPNTYLVEQL